ncbi:DEAD/DEAH box helicase [Oceanibaculum indicum]|uniref:DEAD-box ATP-dependent RNA helicase RhpA n=1 Tax=Oceanibaculum indicum TaxID=526216 RepID=A0A420WQJ9_9PROT|nr:DEAD/DEAH box helicase [Oceanibaculum indicum]RKQ73318.1 superfamily II DNA/RNA helicase [Oceanibaculum indicum]
MGFSDLGLSPDLLRAIEDAGYTTPTPIQEQAIPQVLMGRDVLGVAQTGTGKTAGFTLPMIEILGKGRAKARMPRSLILEPTRELAAQVAENFEKYGKYQKLNMALLIGGVSFSDQEKKIDRGVDVLIATPGRLLDHFGRGKILLQDVKILVIDEADRMLDMGFIPDIERIVGVLPKIRQTLFFSATMAPEIRKLADKFLMNPKEISVAKQASTADTVAQHLVVVGSKAKREALRSLIRSENVKNAFIFCNRKRDIGTLQKSLTQHGFSAVALHGDMTQPARTETLAKFKNNEVSLLVCSDVAARGLDIQAVSHVFNFDVPSNAEDYVHRIGRTGRAGMTGRAYTIATPEDAKYVAAIENLIGKPIPRITPDDVDAEELDMSDVGGKRRRGRSKGKPEAKADEPKKAASAEKPAAKKAAKDKPVSEKPTREKPAREKSARTEPRPEAPRHEPIRDRRDEPKRERDRRYSRDDEPVEVTAGFGDDVPAFLLRTVKLKKSA